MKKIFLILIAAVLALSLLSACSGLTSKVEIISASLIENNDGADLTLCVKNNSSKSINSLSILTFVYDSPKELICEIEIEYPISIESGEQVTMSTQCPKECKSATAVSYSFENADGKKVSKSFKDGYTAHLETAEITDTAIRTREQLADVLIADVKKQFRKDGYSAQGNYNAEANQLLIAAYFKQDYSTCLSVYKSDKETWDTLASGIVSMSKTCLGEFKKYNFMDVQVSIGIMSSDEKILISATDGQLVDMFN